MSTVTYPLRVKSKSCTLVVEFISLQEGTVVVGSAEYPVGEHADIWVRHTNLNVWEPLKTTKRKLHEAGKLMVRSAIWAHVTTH